MRACADYLVLRKITTVMPQKRKVRVPVSICVRTQPPARAPKITDKRRKTRSLSVEVRHVWTSDTSMIIAFSPRHMATVVCLRSLALHVPPSPHLARRSAPTYAYKLSPSILDFSSPHIPLRRSVEHSHPRQPTCSALSRACCFPSSPPSPPARV